MPGILYSYKPHEIQEIVNKHSFETAIVAIDQAKLPLILYHSVTGYSYH
jgi:hypothetical protein